MPLGTVRAITRTPVLQGYVFRLYRERTADMLRRHVADHLVEPRYIGQAEPRQGAIIRHTQQDHPALGIGKRHHLCRQRIRALHTLLELTAAVFA